MYKVVRLTGDYAAREKAANAAGCACVWQQHLNSGSAAARYALVEIAAPYTARERACAKTIADNYARLLGGGLGYGDGVNELADGARGESIIDGNVEAYISEPLFASNAAQAKWVAVRANQTALAKEAVGGLKAHYPDGSVIGLSIGHIGKTSAPSDRGAEVVGTGFTEAAVCTNIIDDMERMLTGGAQGGADDMKQLELVREGYTTLFRLYNPTLVDWLYTASQDEINKCLASGQWEWNGRAFEIPDGGTVPLYRVLLPSGRHLMTTSKSEAALGTVDGTWMVGAVGSGPAVHRGNTSGDAHIVTTSEAEARKLAYQGIAFYLGLPKPPAPVTDAKTAEKAARYDSITVITGRPL